MKKIPTLFQRDPDNRARVLPEVTPGCEWVLNGEGRATRKWDGTCVMYDGDMWWARREVKPGKEAPDGWVEVDTDPVTGKRTGWEPAVQSSFWKMLQEALDAVGPSCFDFAPATYELCGPKINGNPEGFDHHRLVPHGVSVYVTPEGTFDGLRDWLIGPDFDGEGIVFHHPDGRMAKIKVRDFGGHAA